jgi:hypothetical protein
MNSSLQKTLKVARILCVALLPVTTPLSMYLGNTADARFTHFLLVAVIALGVTCFIYLASFRIKNETQRLYLSSWISYLLVNFGAIEPTIQLFNLPAAYRWGLEGVILSAIVIPSCYAVTRWGRGIFLTSYFNIFSAVVALFSISPLFTKNQLHFDGSKFLENIENFSEKLDEVVPPPQLPDIYYAIVDTYPRQDILLDRFGFDNTEFSSKMASLGFNSSFSSCSNYPETIASLSSSLNLQYLPDINDDAAWSIEDYDYGLFARMIDNSQVFKILKNLGYKTYNIDSSFWNPTRSMENADVNVRSYSFSEYFALSVQKSFFWPFEKLSTRMLMHNSIQEKYSAPLKIPHTAEPAFVFVHFMGPHSPYVIKANGDSYSGLNSYWERGSETEDSRYIQQLQYHNNASFEMFDKIIKSNNRPKIIIHHSDHGPTKLTGLNYSEQFSTMTKEDLEDAKQDQFPITFAMYSNQIDVTKMPRNISPVNVFRWVLNQIFDQKVFDLLPNTVNYYDGSMSSRSCQP